MTKVIWWSNRNEIHPEQQMDSGVLHRLFDGSAWPTGYEFEEYVGTPQFTYSTEIPVVIVAARHHVDDVGAINAYLTQFDGVVLVLLGDEEAIFPWSEIVHPNIRFWVMMPHPAKHADMVPWAYFFGTGYKADTVDLLPSAAPEKPLAWVFAGQATHARRKQAVDGLRKAMPRTNGVLAPTSSFTSGMERPEYMNGLAMARIAPCPSGPVTADTMRLYEALEAGCLPIVDYGPEGSPGGFWEFCYGEDHPLIQTNDWNSVGGIIEAELIPSRWPRNANLTSAWWQQQKRGMARRLVRDLTELGAPPPKCDSGDKVTVIITTSPIPSHPSDEILMETITSIDRSMGSIRPQFIIAFDGVRPEQAHLADAYNEYVRQVCWWANRNCFDVLPVVSKHHRHQAGMLKMALEQVDTPLVLVAEHDTPMRPEPIDWEGCIELVDYGALDVLRYHHEASVHPEHEHLMLDHETTSMMGVPIRRTRQFSARPHLARANYYRQVLNRYFPDTSSCFVEDKLYGVALHDKTMRHAIGIYHPEGTIARSSHTDGRAGGDKFDSLQRFQ